MKNTIVRVLLAGLACFTSACGGGGGGSGSGSAAPPPPPPPPPPSVSAGGIWQGTDSVSGLEVIGLVSETGELHFIDDEGTQYFGTASVSGNTVSANLTGYSLIGFTFQDGSTSGTGTFSGTVQERATLTGTTSFRTSRGTQTSGTFSLRYNPLYERDSSLATIGGNFREIYEGFVVNVSSNGVVFAQDPVSGCIVNGTVAIIDARFNAYRVQYSYSGCTGEEAVLNGASFRGLAALDDTTSPEELIVAVTGQAGGAGLSIVWVFSRT